MPIHEIKDPKPVPPGENVKSRRRNVKPVFPVKPIVPIDLLELKREWGGEKETSSVRRESVSKQDLLTARAVINLINDHLEILKKGIHLSLIEGEDGYLLDVHDCSDGKICDKVAELPIDIDDLPILLEKLKNEAGILLDKKI